MASLIQKEWEFTTGDFEKVLSGLTKNDIVYCDPPYHGRHVDYFNTWSLDDEERLARVIQSLDCRFVLSTWSHNAYRKNESIPAFWSDYNVHLKEHYYHAGGKIQNYGSLPHVERRTGVDYPGETHQGHGEQASAKAEERNDHDPIPAPVTGAA